MGLPLTIADYVGLIVGFVRLGVRSILMTPVETEPV